MKQWLNPHTPTTTASLPGRHLDTDFGQIYTNKSCSTLVAALGTACALPYQTSTGVCIGTTLQTRLDPIVIIRGPRRVKPAFGCSKCWKIWNASRICVSSLRRGHANLLCIVPILVYVPPKRVQGIPCPTGYITLHLPDYFLQCFIQTEYCLLWYL